MRTVQCADAPEAYRTSAKEQRSLVRPTPTLSFDSARIVNRQLITEWRRGHGFIDFASDEWGRHCKVRYFMIISLIEITERARDYIETFLTMKSRRCTRGLNLKRTASAGVDAAGRKPVSGANFSRKRWSHSIGRSNAIYGMQLTDGSTLSRITARAWAIRFLSNVHYFCFARC